MARPLNSGGPEFLVLRIAFDFFEEIMAFDSAAQKLKVAYEQALKMANNLPAYEKLLSRGSKD